MATLSIQSQYQTDIQVLAHVVENDKGSRWAESAATVSLSTFISSSREVKVTGIHRDPEKQDVSQVVAFDKNVRVGRYQKATARLAHIGSTA